MDTLIKWADEHPDEKVGELDCGYFAVTLTSLPSDINHLAMDPVFATRFRLPQHQEVLPRQVGCL